MTLRLEPTLGTPIDTALSESARIGNVLGLEWVEFEFNGHKFTVYPRGEALEFSVHDLVASWNRSTGRWLAVNPKRESFGWRG